VRTDCPLVGGDSGGPLFDMYGKVVGIHSRIGDLLSANIHVPVESYRPLCDRIADGLRTFRDADTGEPLVSEIGFAEQIFADGPMRQYLPDIVVRWNPTAAALHRRVVSDSFGSIAWPTPGRHPLGRSGNHRRRGFLIGAGGPFAEMQHPGDAHVLDLAPTALDLLGVRQPASFQGRSLLRESR
jgi:hypothetical protein